MLMKQGFSLVELSIVLVILGLLVGGVLSGQALIRASELRALTAEYQRYAAATYTFRDKYFALPGDMTNATAFWGVAAAGAACETTIGTGTQTCNGNGDGHISDTGSGNEPYLYWQHLANASIIEGSYIGIQDGMVSYASTSRNSPRSKISNSLWSIFNWGVVSGDGMQFDGNYVNFYMFGAAGPNSAPENSNLKPEELWNIDTKLDDGMPATGKVIARPYTNCTTATASTQSNATYALLNTGVVCRALFNNNF